MMQNFILSIHYDIGSAFDERRKVWGREKHIAALNPAAERHDGAKIYEVLLEREAGKGLK
jgi:hypothetical protein